MLFVYPFIKIKNDMTRRQKFYLPFKRLIGIFGSLVGIIFCFIILWWWIIPVNAIVTKGHPFFASRRIGKNGKTFRCLKFRSMKLSANPNLTSRDEIDESNVTGFGKFLRRTSIDETLQLFNIFAGQMAFIGPRPLINVNGDSITINLRKENGSYRLRPGLSGLAQMHKRGNLDPETKAGYDEYYFNHFSFWLDTKLFFQTIFGVCGRKDGSR